MPEERMLAIDGLLTDAQKVLDFADKNRNPTLRRSTMVMPEQPSSPFQLCMAELERVARRMWVDGVERKTLYQHLYLWPMAAAIDAYTKAIMEQLERGEEPERMGDEG